LLVKTRCAACVGAFETRARSTQDGAPQRPRASLDQTSVLSSKGRPSGATVHPRAQLRRRQGQSHLRCDQTRCTHTASTDSGAPRGDLRGRTQSAHMSSSALDCALVRRGRGPTCRHCRAPGRPGHRPNGQVSAVECTAAISLRAEMDSFRGFRIDYIELRRYRCRFLPKFAIARVLGS
jgi:hypothetical protein